MSKIEKLQSQQEKLAKQQAKLLAKQEHLQKEIEEIQCKDKELTAEAAAVEQELYSIDPDAAEEVKAKIEEELEEPVPYTIKEHWAHYKKHFFDRGSNDHLSGYELFWILVICSVLGYCIEMVFGRITNGFWESRQSLVYGPFGLAYGLGGVVLTVLLFRDTHQPMWRVFLKSFIWMSVAEYIMSLGEEIVFGAVSWDYSNMPLNINGRICLLYSLFWGLLGLVWCKICYPGLKKLINLVPIGPGRIAFMILGIFLLYDCITSAQAMLRYNERQEGIPADSAIDRLMDKQFPDEYLEWVYANAMSVDDEGNASDKTISGRDAKTYNTTTVAATATITAKNGEKYAVMLPLH